MIGIGWAFSWVASSEVSAPASLLVKFGPCRPAAARGTPSNPATDPRTPFRRFIADPHFSHLRSVTTEGRARRYHVPLLVNVQDAVALVLFIAVPHAPQERPEPPRPLHHRAAALVARDVGVHRRCLPSRSRGMRDRTPGTANRRGSGRSFRTGTRVAPHFWQRYSLGAGWSRPWRA